MPESVEQLTENMEEVPLNQMPFPQPPIEEIIHNCIINLHHLEGPEGEFTLLQFITPVKVISIRINKEAAEGLSAQLKKSPIQLATMLDLPKGLRR